MKQVFNILMFKIIKVNVGCGMTLKELNQKLKIHGYNIEID